MDGAPTAAWLLLLALLRLLLGPGLAQLLSHVCDGSGWLQHTNAVFHSAMPSVAPQYCWLQQLRSCTPVRLVYLQRLALFWRVLPPCHILGVRHARL